jgi:hypothetical protein
MIVVGEDEGFGRCWGGGSWSNLRVLWAVKIEDPGKFGIDDHIVIDKRREERRLSLHYTININLTSQNKARSFQKIPSDEL